MWILEERQYLQFTLFYYIAFLLYVCSTCLLTLTHIIQKDFNKKSVWLKSQIIMIYHRIPQSYHGDNKKISITNFQLFVYILEQFK